jgi:hypothetical protein
MTRLGPDPEHWLPELRDVLFAIGRAVGKRNPSMVLIMALKPEYEHCVADHKASIEYFPEGYTDDTEHLPEYVVSLKGKRVLASWLLLERDFYGFIQRNNPKD